MNARSIAALAVVVAVSTVGAVAFAGPAQAADGIDFAPAQYYRTGGRGGPGPHETTSVAADFDVDGDIDVVSTDYYIGLGPRLNRNNGDGRFQPGEFIPGTYLGSTVVAGDWNEDGKPDLAVNNFNSVNILIGNGDGTFTRSQTFFLFQAGQEDALAADVNTDGNEDLVVRGAAGVKTYLGSGNGQFTEGPQTLVAPSLNVSLAGIDEANLNGDGIPDLVTVDGIVQLAYTLTGNGDGSFTTVGISPVPILPAGAFAGDFNEDGIDDTVVFDELNVVLNGVVLISDGDGGFASSQRYDVGIGPVSGEIADLNSDGHLDIIASDTVGNQVVVLLGDGSGAFTEGGRFPVTFFGQTPVVADFDGDDRPDIALGTVGAPIADSLLGVLLNSS